VRVEIAKPVNLHGEIKRSGVVEVPDPIGRHWLATGAAVAPATQKPPEKDKKSTENEAAAASGEKQRS